MCSKKITAMHYMGWFYLLAIVWFIFLLGFVYGGNKAHGDLPKSFGHQTIYAYTGQILTAKVCIPVPIDTEMPDWPNFSLEWKLLHFESGTQMGQGTSTSESFTFSVPRTGFFVLQVQYDKGDGSPKSGWKDSRQAQPSVPGITECHYPNSAGFWVHGETAPAGMGSID